MNANDYNLDSRNSNAPALTATRFLHLVATAAALLVIAPVVAVLSQSLLGEGQGTVTHLVQTVLPRFLLASIELSFGVLSLSLLMGVGCAWLVAAFEFPLRRWLMPALVLPLAVPAFVMAYAYTDALDSSGSARRGIAQLTGGLIGGPGHWFEIRSMTGAAVMLSLALYPYVFLLARVAFAERSQSLADAARSLGVSGLTLWWKVTIPAARPAIVAGAALVLMETLADFGAVSYFAVDTLSAGIYRAWQGMGDSVAAARLAVILLVGLGAVAWVERRFRSRLESPVRVGRVAPRRLLRGANACLAVVACATPVVLGFVAPVLLLIRATRFADGGLDERIWAWTFNSALLGAGGSAVTVTAALLAAYAVRFAPGAWTVWASRVACSGYALPGVVIAVGMLAILQLADLVGMPWLRSGLWILVWAYSVRFFSVAFQSLQAGLKRVSPAMDSSARSLGEAPGGVLRRVHWPMLKPSLGVAALLVFVDGLKELPATLVLRPFDFDTLAVVAYQFASDERLSMAAAPSLVIVALALIPTGWLAWRVNIIGSAGA
jgi:iron(III) transport system permease protein